MSLPPYSIIFLSLFKVSPEMAHMLSRCVVKDPSRRATASELLRHPLLNKAQHPSCIAHLINNNEKPN
ncbi:hypothetical protein Y032_0574g179 [Ancylostoma ceylanicum]|uniref:Protein kinase domain-containing protein n=1 Tax=Ancylostoma ceylanicum TaxID=53326 RepID=A0A016WNW2_9BILA|nr:hypothetical protein Y032_0574g179 [Ancylostoma ceylanicum]